MYQIKQFSESQKIAVWDKARIVQGYDSAYVRADTCGMLIEWVNYGNINVKSGWEIDHIFPESRGGTNDISNLQPLQWENNRRKGDGPNSGYCLLI